MLLALSIDPTSEWEMATMRENRNQHALGVVALVALLLGRPCHAQMEPCPSNGALTGYASIAALNNDIEAELARISGGGEPENEYVYMLCPRQEFDAALEPLRPLLSGSVFRCGVSGQSTDRCTIQGGSEQIRIEDSVISTFPLNDVSFVGLTFDGFTNNADNTGASVNVLASATTKVTFSDVVWQVSTRTGRAEILQTAMIFLTMMSYVFGLSCIRILTQNT